MTVSKNLFSLSRWLLFIGYCALLYVSYTLPGEAIPEPIARANDKVLHFLDFFILGLLSFRTFAVSSLPLFYAQAGRKATGFSLLYGAFLEFLQGRVPGREASFGDWVADALGVVVASGIFRISRLTLSSWRARLTRSKP